MEETEKEYKNKFFSLGDEYLYKEEIISSRYTIGYTEKFYLPSLNYPVDSHIVLVHYLNGKPYTANEFKQIKPRLDLKSELNKEVSINQNSSQKLKL